MEPAWQEPLWQLARGIVAAAAAAHVPRAPHRSSWREEWAAGECRSLQGCGAAEGGGGGGRYVCAGRGDRAVWAAGPVSRAWLRRNCGEDAAASDSGAGAGHGRQTAT